LATVITNLLSAIPVFGQDLVELIWTLILDLNFETNFKSLNNIIFILTFTTKSKKNY